MIASLIVALMPPAMVAGPLSREPQVEAATTPAVAPSRDPRSDPCVGVWTVGAAYVSVHASGRMERHAEEKAGNWRVTELVPVGRPLRAALQSKDALHAVGTDGAFLTAASPRGPFHQHGEALASAEHHWRGNGARRDEVHRGSKWLLLPLEGWRRQLVECVGTELRVVHTSSRATFGLSRVDSLGRVLIADAKSEGAAPIRLWLPATDGFKSYELPGTQSGRWSGSGVILGSMSQPILFAVEELTGRALNGAELVQFEFGPAKQLKASRRMPAPSFIGFGPQDLRVGEHQLYATTGAAGVAAIELDTLQMTWNRSGQGSGLAGTRAWIASDGKSLAVYGSADAFSVLTEDGSPIEESALPRTLRSIWGAGRKGEVIGLLEGAAPGEGDRVVILRSGGDWGVTYELQSVARPPQRR